LVTEFTGPAPADLKPYQDAFQSALRFDAPAHRLVFACADCLSPLQTSNPLLAQLHERFANEKLNRLGHTKVSCRARDLIVRHLSGGEPLRRDIASALCMSERTLQRRLQAEKTSFQDLVDTTRKELAKQYLRQRDLTLTQNAALLGFADPSTFFRSCRRWFGMSPHEYRTVAYKTWDARIQGGLEA
jgi:AraC-like DNA-binding protein